MFSLRTEEEVLTKIDFIDTHIIPKNLDSYIKKFYAFPDPITLSVKMGKYTGFPDIFLKPYPMVSEMLMDVMRMYRIEPFFKRVMLDDRNSGEFKIYYLLYVDEESVSIYQDFQLKRSQEDELTCLISLDFAESILRRDAQGIQLLEWNEEED